MKITHFEVHDRLLDWTLEDMRLDAFNLLVGVSGAGKTRIIRALERVCRVAMGGSEGDSPWDSSWVLTFEHQGTSYRWEVETEPPPVFEGGQNGSTRHAEQPLIHRERLIQGERTLLDRTPEKLEVGGKPTVRLDRARSAFTLLKEDEAFSPFYRAFSQVIFDHRFKAPDYGLESESWFEQEQERYRSAEELVADVALPLHHKAEMLQARFPDEFRRIQEWFHEAFPTVEELRVLRLRENAAGGQRFYSMALCAREAGVSPWISFGEMSSGMQRFLVLLVHLAFAPRGTVALIDELEASMGVNCLPAVTRFLLSRAPDLQFVITSHHPYIIDQIPPRHWKLVTRRGSHVRVLGAADVPALREHSHLDAFTRLMNLSEYTEGVSS